MNPKKANYTKDLDTFSKMDPYLVLEYGKAKYQTKVAKDAGKTPVWTDKFTVDFDFKENETLNISCFNTATFGSDSLFASAQISLRKNLFDKMKTKGEDVNKFTISETIDVLDDKKNAFGTVTIDFEMIAEIKTKKGAIEVHSTNPNRNYGNKQDQFDPTLINSTYMPEKPGGKNLNHSRFDNTKFDHEKENQNIDGDLQLNVMANQYRNLERQY